MRREIFVLSLLIPASPVLAADAPSVAVQTVALKQQMMTANIFRKRHLYSTISFATCHAERV